MNSLEKLPVKKGILAVNSKINSLPDDSLEKQELLKIRNEALDAIEAITSIPNQKQLPRQGRLNSGRKKLSSRQYAEKIAQQMLEAGKTPQEIGAVVAAILGFKD